LCCLHTFDDFISLLDLCLHLRHLVCLFLLQADYLSTSIAQLCSKLAILRSLFFTFPAILSLELGLLLLLLLPLSSIAVTLLHGSIAFASHSTNLSLQSADIFRVLLLPFTFESACGLQVLILALLR